MVSYLRGFLFAVLAASVVCGPVTSEAPSLVSSSAVMVSTSSNQDASSSNAVDDAPAALSSSSASVAPRRFGPPDDAPVLFLPLPFLDPFRGARAAFVADALSRSFVLQVDVERSDTAGGPASLFLIHSEGSSSSDAEPVEQAQVGGRRAWEGDSVRHHHHHMEDMDQDGEAPPPPECLLFSAFVFVLSFATLYFVALRAVRACSRRRGAAQSLVMLCDSTDGELQSPLLVAHSVKTVEA